MSDIVLEPLPGDLPGHRVKSVDGVRVTMGLYRIHWREGGASIAAIGMCSDGQWWVAPTNWIAPASPLPIQADGGRTSWLDVARVERLAEETE